MRCDMCTLHTHVKLQMYTPKVKYVTLYPSRDCVALSPPCFNHPHTLFNNKFRRMLFVKPFPPIIRCTTVFLKLLHNASRSKKNVSPVGVCILDTGA